VSEPRKASEVLLELESKLDKLISLSEAQILSFKILSNKLNEVLTVLQRPGGVANKITVEAVNTAPVSKIPVSPLEHFTPTDPERQVPVFASARLSTTDSPEGFRRTSRPETFIDDPRSDPAPVLQVPAAPKYPVQVIKGAPPPGRGSNAEIAVPVLPSKPVIAETKPVSTVIPQTKEAHDKESHDSIPVFQRVVDKNSKSIFMADVEIIDVATNTSIHKTRTAGTGKWMASLVPGNYRVIIKKQQNLNKEKELLEAIQDIQVTGQVSPLELKMLIIK
jgi:hypothetical protein